jgi:hypothetical protein
MKLVHRSLQRAWPAGLSLAYLTLAISAAAAQAPVASSGDDERPVAYEKPQPHEVSAATQWTMWYGIPLIIADGVSFGMLVVGQTAPSLNLTRAGVIFAILDGLFIHVNVNRTPDRIWLGLGKGLLSVALRGGLGTAACFADSGCNEWTRPALLRLSLGILAGAIIDILWLTHQSVDEKPRFELSLLLEAGGRHDAIGLRCFGRW